MRKAFLVLSCAWALLRQEDAGATHVDMTCERNDAPGRVRCDVQARVDGDETISAGDVIIVRTPPFLTALRGRIGPHDATLREATAWRWALALAATGRGAGDVEARVRLVVCRQATCTPREVPVVAHVIVGE